MPQTLKSRNQAPFADWFGRFILSCLSLKDRRVQQTAAAVIASRRDHPTSLELYSWSHTRAIFTITGIRRKVPLCLHPVCGLSSRAVHLSRTGGWPATQPYTDERGLSSPHQRICSVSLAADRGALSAGK